MCAKVTGQSNWNGQPNCGNRQTAAFRTFHADKDIMSRRTKRGYPGSEGSEPLSADQMAKRGDVAVMEASLRECSRRARRQAVFANGRSKCKRADGGRSALGAVFLI
jgi:hypothetical protein